MMLIGDGMVVWGVLELLPGLRSQSIDCGIWWGGVVWGWIRLLHPGARLGTPDHFILFPFSFA
jgi:hypothetical protein